MILAITEVNAWEREKWTYLFELEKQSADVINDLFIFQRVANEIFEKELKNAPRGVMARSKYWIKFYDRIEMVEGRSYPIAFYGKQSITLNSIGNQNYKDGGIFLDIKLSPRRMRGAMVSIRDKEEDRLYKNVESLFMSKGAHAKSV